MVKTGLLLVDEEDERLKIEEKEYFKMSEIHESHQRNMNINQRKGRRIER